jgi:MscS family membrane protein
MLGLVLEVASALGQQSVHPLQPPDRSSPRATLKTFLDSSDAAATFFVKDYRPSPTREAFRRLFSLCDTPMKCLDLSEVPPASRIKTGGAAALALYEVLSRIELPPLEDIPGARPELLASTNVARWAVPNTEIVLVRTASGPNASDFLFSADTVARANDFYNRVRDLPYARPVPAQGLYERRITGGGWLIPVTWVEGMPLWLRSPLGGQAVWKWVALVLVLGFFAVLLRVAYRSSLRGGDGRPFLQALARLQLPLFFLVATPLVAYLALVQVNFIGHVGSAIQLISVGVRFLSGAWLSWRAAPVVAEAIIASPKIAPESIDAHLIRICSRLLGLIAAAALLAFGADRIGMPVFGIIAGLGVGGLAIALAAQPTIENLIGSLNLFADKPIRVGNFCRYGDSLGTVEAIGIRSTRIRGVDRTLTTIPNATLSKMPIVNFTQRDRMLIRATIGVRCETSAEQLRFLLAKLREMLIAHPSLLAETARARLTGFGASSRDIEVFAYAKTADWPEFLGIQEDVFLRIIDTVQQSGTAFALPSQTLYLGRDSGLDTGKAESAEAQVRRWREESRLPFPDFAPEQVETMKGKLDFPPEGSAKNPLASTLESFSPAAPRSGQTLGDGKTQTAITTPAVPRDAKQPSI